MLAKLTQTHVLDRHGWPQYMAGGDLGSAISRDVAEHDAGPQRRLGWYNRGSTVLLCVARGLVYLHNSRVREARLRWPHRFDAQWAPA